MNVAVVYDRVNKWGGAEKVLLRLHKIFPQAPLYCAVYDPESAPWAKKFPKVIPSFLNKIAFFRKNHEFLGFLTPIAFESFNFDEYDLVISVTSEAAKGIITKPKTKHICYCLTPTRYLWSGYEEYQKNPPKKLSRIPFYQQLSKPFISYLRKWDLIASSRPDEMIAISSAVQKRIEKYYHRSSKIIFPPVETTKFKTGDSKKKNESLKDYYLIVSRLVPYKKVDLAVRAFNKLGKNLVVIGKGSELEKLKSIATKNTMFEGFLSEKKLIEYFHGAKAFLYPQEEDFGITAVEAQAAGVPVIAYKMGGAVDTVIEGKTGIFFNNQTEESLIMAINRFERFDYDKQLIMNNSEKFSEQIFTKEILGIVNSLM